VQWDTAAYWGKCGFIQKELKRQKIWGSGKLTKVWLSEVLRNPLETFNLMSASFHKSLRDPNSRSMFYNPAMPSLFHWEVEMSPPRMTSGLVYKYVNSPINDRMGRPLMFVVITVVALVLLTFRRMTINNEGLFAAAVLCSGLLNIVSYFFLTVSCEYRYFYWSAFAVYLGFVMTVLSIVAQSRGVRGAPLEYWLKICIFALLSISIGLVAASKPFPSLERQVSLTPLDKSSIKVVSLRRASIPNWMGIKYHGDLSPHEWQMDEKGLLQANAGSGALTATIPTQGKAIEIEMEKGVNKGSVLIESDGFSEVVDLSSPSQGKEVLYIWPTQAYSIRSNHTPWRVPLAAFLYALSTIGLLCWIDMRFKRMP
jgi:hypothetical protein